MTKWILTFTGITHKIKISEKMRVKYFTRIFLFGKILYL
ncbi:MAG: hypothetical protein ACI9JT_001964 [Polaribacter sp.]|jgi:hypothetical protein